MNFHAAISNHQADFATPDPSQISTVDQQNAAHFFLNNADLGGKQPHSSAVVFNQKMNTMVQSPNFMSPNHRDM